MSVGGKKKSFSWDTEYDGMKTKQKNALYHPEGKFFGEWFGITASTVWTFPPQQGTFPSLKEADKVIRQTSTPSMTEVSGGTRPGFLQQLFICITAASRSTSPRLEPLCARGFTHPEERQLLQLAIQVGINRKIRLTEKHQIEISLSKFSVQCVSNWKEDYDICLKMLMECSS